jgi:hypothetical protein
MRAERDKKVKEKIIEVGPFLIIEKPRPGSFRLTDTEGKVLQHS